MPDKERNCGNCVNCDKFMYEGKETWACEEYGFFFNGVAPVDCTPPNDQACRLWTDDPKKRNTWEKYV